MAHVNCPNCAASISDKAINCPHCHHRMESEPRAKAGPALAKVQASMETAEPALEDESPAGAPADPEQIPTSVKKTRPAGPRPQGSGRRKPVACLSVGCLVLSIAVILSIVVLAVAPIFPEEALPTPVVTRGPLAEAATARFGDRLQRATIEQTGGPAAGDTGAETQSGGAVVRVAAVDYVLGDVATEDAAIQAMASDFAGLSSQLVTVSDFDTLEVRAFGRFHDDQGNDREEMASKLTIRRTALSATDWGTLNPRDLNQLLSGENGAIFVHPLLQAAWDSYALAR